MSVCTFKTCLTLRTTSRVCVQNRVDIDFEIPKIVF